MNLRLRSIELREEADGLGALLGRALDASYPTPDAGPDTGPVLGAAFLDAHFGDGAALLLVAEGDGVLAIAATAPFRDPVTLETLPLLAALWVDPSIRQRGVARELVRELRRLVAQHGFPALLARVGTGDDALLAMAERWGLVRGQELLSTR